MDNSGSFNKYLQPINTPVTKPDSFVKGIDFDIYNDRGIISSAKFRMISFSKLTGGTATLGGVGNGNGLLTVLNAGGTEVVRLDNTGIVISSGSISGVQFTGTTTQTTGTFDTITITGQDTLNGTLTNNGVIKSGVVGTSTVTGGTVNPDLYQAGGTNGVDGSIVYVKSVNFAGSTTTLGTVRFKGVVYSNA